ncbi:MAG: DNA repair protein RadC [Eubacteriales bacterium]|nr:DNA repair protein RadC [Eubacteriales bacterium]
MLQLLETEKPYEKLSRFGAQRLTDVELLAIILRTGTREKSPLDLAREILQNSSGLRGISHLCLAELQKIKGIGKVKAIQLKAVIEIAKRFHKEGGKVLYQIDSPKSIADYYMEEMCELKQEHFKVILLNTRNEIIEDKDLFIGTVNRSLVSPREVFEYALKNSAVSIIFMHNHPSGNPEPSKEDIHLTKRCAEIAKLVDIAILDHIIIGRQQYVSLKQRQLF